MLFINILGFLFLINIFKKCSWVFGTRRNLGATPPYTVTRAEKKELIRSTNILIVYYCYKIA